MRFAQARDSSGIRAKRTGAATRSVGAFLKSPGLNFAPHGFSGLELIGISCRVNRRLDGSQAVTANHNFVRRLQPRWLDTSTVVGQNFSEALRSIYERHMEQTLLLNASYEPLKIVHWQKAITLLCQGKVEVISVYDREIRAVSISFKLPSVIRLLRYIKIKRRFDYVPFSRANIYARDDHRCQYCGDGFPTSELTFDHVLPVAQGGRKDWENIVTCCVTCNRRKGGRTPAEAGMHLKRMPRRPESAPAIRITVGLRNAPESWRDYLYWNAELDDS